MLPRLFQGQSGQYMLMSFKTPRNFSIKFWAIYLEQIVQLNLDF